MIVSKIGFGFGFGFGYGVALCLALVLCSLIAHPSAITSTALEVDKIGDKPNRVSYYASGRLQQQSPTPPTTINVSYNVDQTGHNDDVTQLETAGAGTLLHQLIYELGVEHKHIPRLSLLTCQHGSPTRRRMREQTRTSINIDMLTILRTLFTGRDNRRRYLNGGGYSGGSNANTDAGVDVDVDISNSSSSDDRPRLDHPPPLRGVLIKVLRIDLLINSRANESIAHKKRFGSETAAATGCVPLEGFLRSEVLRQLVVLDLSCGLASRKVIEMASNKGLFNSSYHWILIEDYTFNRQPGDEDALADDWNDGDDVENDFQLPKKVNTADATSSSAISTDADDEINKSRDTGSSPTGQAGEDYSYVDGNNLLIEKFLEKINININTELILAKRINGDQDSKGDYYMLYDVWNPGLQYGGQLNVTEIGKFSKDAGLQLHKWYRQTTTIVRRMDMKRARIRCMVVVTNNNFSDSLEDYLTHHYDTHLDSMNRFNFALISNVRDLFNFSLVMSRTTSWGYLKNGTFDGMIGALVRRQADISGSPIFFRIERAKVIDYTTRTWVSRPCFIFRHPRTIRTNQIVFLQPFTNNVWVMVAVCAGLTVVLLTALTMVERKLNNVANKSLDLGAAGTGSGDNLHGRTDDRNRKGNRQTDSELSCSCSARQRDTVPLARHSILRDVGPRFGGSTDSKATTSGNEKVHIGAGRLRMGPTVSSPEQSAIDCIDDGGVGINGPTNKLSSRNNNGGRTRWSVLRKILNGFRDGARGISLKQRIEMMLESLLFSIGSICQQGLAFSTNFLSGRCIVFTSLLFSFCIYQFYSASIVGTLLMEKPKTIKTLRDLIHSSLEIGIENIIYNREYFLRTQDPDSIELYTKKVTPTSLYPDQATPAGPQSLTTDTNSKDTSNDRAKKNQKATKHSRAMNSVHSKASKPSTWYDPESGVAKIKQGDVATAYKIIADTFTEKEVCDLTEIQLFAPQKTVSIVQKGSPLRKVITYGLRRSWEAGLMDYQRKVWHSPKPRCVKQIHTDDLRVDMQTFTSAVSVLIFGFAASIVVLLLEQVHNNLWQYFAT